MRPVAANEAANAPDSHTESPPSSVVRGAGKILSFHRHPAILCGHFMSGNRIDSTFARLRAERRAGFIAYICAGDPTLDATRELVPALERAGVDIVELGVPFSDPLADGVVNQMASTRALAAGATLNGLLACVRDIRRRSQVPIVLYTYMNPVYRHGFDAFLADAEAAGADGVLFLDLPPDEDEASPELRMHGALKRIRLIAPTTPSGRIALLTRDASGFIYYVSREGVTGERSDLASGLAERVAAIKKTTSLPVAVGFGIGTPGQVRDVAQVADAVVVGSAIVKRIAEFGSDPALVEKVAAFVRPLAAAVRDPR
jgi:tryptophan synthase alpha chain